MAQSQTLSKALDILNALGKSDKYLSVEEIAAILDAPESTTYRLLQTLETKGFILRYSRKKIGLGSNFINLARNLYERLDRELALISMPYLTDLCEKTKETTILSVRAGLDSKCIKSVSSKYIIRFVSEENRLLKLNIGASSKAILAYEDPKIVNLVMNTLESEAEKDVLRTALEEIKGQGYAVSCNEYDISALGLGVPVFNSFGKIYASIAIVGPESRVRPEHYEGYIKILKNASEEITEKLKFDEKQE